MICTRLLLLRLAYLSVASALVTLALVIVLVWVPEVDVQAAGALTRVAPQVVLNRTLVSASHGTQLCAKSCTPLPAVRVPRAGECSCQEAKAASLNGTLVATCPNATSPNSTVCFLPGCLKSVQTGTTRCRKGPPCPVYTCVDPRGWAVQCTLRPSSAFAVRLDFGVILYDGSRLLTEANLTLSCRCCDSDSDASLRVSRPAVIVSDIHRTTTPCQTAYYCHAPGFDAAGRKAGLYIAAGMALFFAASCIGLAALAKYNVS